MARGRPFNLAFIAVCCIGIAMTVELQLAGVDPRLVSAIYGGVALGGIVYRLITTWMQCSALVHALGICTCLLLAIGALINLQLAGYGPGAVHPPSEPLGASWASAYVRLACMILALQWRAWLAKKSPPWRD